LSGPEFAPLRWGGRDVSLELRWIAREAATAPLVVFLHEGLGSVSMWRDFPDRLCAAARCRGLVYSRPGYGRSTPRAADEHWQPDFMHRQAHEVLPALFAALGIDTAADPPWLLGHSDGGTIALLYAARHPERCAGVIALAPHILAESGGLASIRRARVAYHEGELRARLARHHADPDSAFWGWNEVWLDPRFERWSIEDEIAPIRCPVLAIQGVDDEYGTLEQVRGIARRVPQTRVLELPACGHSAHRDQPDAVIEASVAMLAAAVPQHASKASGHSPSGSASAP